MANQTTTTSTATSNSNDGGSGKSGMISSTLQWLIPASLLTNRDKIILNKLTIWEACQWLIVAVPVYVLMTYCDFIDFVIRLTIAVMIALLGFRFIHVPSNGLVGTEWAWAYFRYQLEERSGRHYAVPASHNGNEAGSINSINSNSNSNSNDPHSVFNDYGSVGRPVYLIEPGPGPVVTPAPTVPAVAVVNEATTATEGEAAAQDHDNENSLPVPGSPVAAPRTVALNDLDYLADLDLDLD